MPIVPGRSLQRYPYQDDLDHQMSKSILDAKIQLHKSCLGRKKCRFRDSHFDHSAIVQGATTLKSGVVDVPDLRAGFAYLMAALLAEGTSRIGGIEYVKRGYSYIQEKLAAVGGSILEITPAAGKVQTRS